MSVHSTLSGPVATILFYGDDNEGSIRDAAFRSHVALKHVSSHSKSSELKSGPNLVAFLVHVQKQDILNYHERIQKIREEWPHLPGIVVFDVDSVASFDFKMVSRLVPLVQYWALSKPNEIESIFRILLTRSEERGQQEKSRRELGLRNRQLRDLRENLESRVIERTAYLVDAERELYNRSQGTRDLVRFIKELSQLDSIEEILQHVSNEVRGFHEVRPPILAVSSPEFGSRLYFQQSRGSGGRVTQRTHEKSWGAKRVQKLWSARSSIRISDSNDQEYLASELGRPVARTIVLPLGTRGGSNVPLLIFEHSFDAQKSEAFVRFWTVRLESLSMALDRVVFNRELFAASRIWETIFDGIPDPVAVLTENYEPIRLNKAFAASDKRACYEIFAQRDSPCPGCRLNEAIQNGKAEEWQVRRGDRVFRVKSYPIRLSRMTAIVHYTDITKGLELKGYAIQGEKMAAIGLMAGNIAHELNNPLAGLRSLAQVLEADKRFPIEVRKDLKEIELAAERSSRIIKDLMEFSKADDHERSVVSLNSVIASSINMIKTALHEYSVETKLGLDAELMVKVDPHLLQHVLFNIINNATQAMRASGDIEIVSRREGAWAEVRISDSGPGISEEIRSRIFEPFFTTKPAGQGTGLGLSMSRWIVENHGGVITVENHKAPRHGAIFTIRLPVHAKRTEVPIVASESQ